MEKLVFAIVVSSALLSCSVVTPQVGDRVTPCVNTDSDPSVAVVFGRDIRPLMDRKKDDPSGPGCRSCHYSGETYHVGLDEGRLDLQTLGALRQGGVTSGTSIVVPGDACKSALVQKLFGTYPFGEQMPEDAPRHWNAAEGQLVVDWIVEGAHGEDSE